MNRFLAFLILLISVGCSKEYSFESPLPPGSLVVVGNNCIVNKILDFDSVANKNVNVKSVEWNTTGNYPTKIFEIDSLTGQTVFSKNISLIGDTFKIDNKQYFLVDVTNNYRVREFVGYNNPYATSGVLSVHKFIYDTKDRLITKLTYSALQPGIVYTQTNYKYNIDSSNLIKIETKIPLNGNVLIYEANIEYNSGKTPKNFLYYFVESEDLRPYMQFYNFGKKPKNEVSRIVVKKFDQLTGTPTTTTTTNFYKYIYSGDGYVLSVVDAGHHLLALGLNNSKNNFGYFCK
jgi:hypothetical protein